MIGSWREVVEVVDRSKPTLAKLLLEAEVAAWTSDAVRIRFGRGCAFHFAHVSEPQNIAEIEMAILGVTGEAVPLVVTRVK